MKNILHKMQELSNLAFTKNKFMKYCAISIMIKELQILYKYIQFSYKIHKKKLYSLHDIYNNSL